MPDRLPEGLEGLGPFCDMMMDTLIAALKEAKEELVKNGPDDLPTRVMYMSIKLDQLHGIVPVMPDIPGLDPPTGLGLILLVARQKLGSPAMVVFICEAYQKIYNDQEESAEDMAHYERGMFADDPKAQEAITVHIAHLMPDGIAVRHLFASMPFVYGDGGVIFGEMHRVTSEDATDTDGAIIRVIRAAFVAQNN